MGYYEGQKLFRLNKKTHNIDTFRIIDTTYVLDKKIGSRINFTAKQLDELISRNEICLNNDELKLQAIKDLEQKFDIKLQEVNRNE